MFQLIIKNPSEPNWEFNDEYENFDELVERIKRTLQFHKGEIMPTTIYNLKPLEIKIYNLKKTEH